MNITLFTTVNLTINPRYLKQEIIALGFNISTINPYGYNLQEKTRAISIAKEPRILGASHGVATDIAQPGEIRVYSSAALTVGEKSSIQSKIDNHNSENRSTEQIVQDVHKQDRIDLQVVIDTNAIVKQSSLKKLLRWSLHQG